MKTQYFKFVEKAKKSNLFGIKAGNTRTRRRAFKGNVASFRGFYETQKTSAPNSFLYFFTSTNSAQKNQIQNIKFGTSIALDQINNTDQHQ